MDDLTLPLPWKWISAFFLVLALAALWVGTQPRLLTPVEAVSDGDLRKLWEQGDLSQMERLAEAGDVRAQHWMGLMLHNRQRYDEAIEWYARAADGGDGKSANRIAFFYDHGVGRPKNHTIAMNWHRKAAALGDFSSQIRYAAALREGNGVARNEREAFRWYARAATQHDYEQAGYAYLRVSEMLFEGRVVPQDLQRAYAFAKAAEPTVDDSDAGNQKKARFLQKAAAARLSPADLATAKQMFKQLRPDLAQRSANWTGLKVLLVVTVLTVIGRRFWRRRKSQRRLVTT